MILSIFEYTDYKEYLNALIPTLAKSGRGIRRQLAEAMRCQVAYVSHVLAGSYHFSLEQAEAVTRFFGLAKDEAEYFVLLVSSNRAGTPELRGFLRKMLVERLSKRQQLKTRLKIQETLDRENQNIYYSRWYFAAIHALLGIREFQTKDAIAVKLGLPKATVAEVLEFLSASGLAKREGSRFNAAEVKLHLEQDSPLIARHHTNWRIRAMHSLDDIKTHDMHYSGALTCSVEDIQRVREILTRALQECIDLVRCSGEQRAAAIGIDFFEL